jgi:alpha-L-fucosidase
MPVTRREFLGTIAAASALSTVALAARARGIEDPPARPEVRPPRPSPAQLQWQKDELAMFCHFGVNTFTDREWGDGTEDPAIFAPARLDTHQWTRAARTAGFRTAILTAKHHDGFCLWPTRTTAHSIAKSAWRGGTGDLVREFVDACRADKLNVGLYLSPWDRHEPVYGDSPRYNDFYCDQLRELLTRYGPIAEVWFDGANGEGPNGKKQTYDWPRIWSLVRSLQPKAVIFSDAGPDIRWIGTENGVAGDPNWSTVDPSVVSVPGLSGAAVTRMLQHGDPRGTAWRPGETDVSIRPGWFHHPAEDVHVKTVDQLVSLFCTSVGRNSKLLLNVPPTRDGLLHETDVARLTGMRRALDAMFLENRATDATLLRPSAAQPAPRLATDVHGDAPISVIDLREDIAQGQFVSSYRVEGETRDGWIDLSHGQTIGFRKIDRIAPVSVRALRVTLNDAPSAPLRVKVRAFGP